MSSSIPRSRKISTVRWLVMWARGVFAVHEYLVMTMWSTPSVASVNAAVAPAGPVPMTSTSVLMFSATPRDYSLALILVAHPVRRDHILPADLARAARWILLLIDV